MHEARGQSHSRTSPATQVTCLPDAAFFPLPRVAFHLASVIHLSFSTCDRDSCVADSSPLCFSNFAFSVCFSFSGAAIFHFLSPVFLWRVNILVFFFLFFDLFFQIEVITRQKMFPCMIVACLKKVEMCCSRHTHMVKICCSPRGNDV